MVTVDYVTRAVESCVAIFCLLLYWLWLRRDYETDLFRNRLFAIRNELFDFALSGRIAFHDPAYGSLRSSMNGLIRYAHRFTFWQVLWLLTKYNRTDAQAATEKWHRSLQSLDLETREAVQRYRITLGLLVLGHLIRTSAIPLLLLGPLRLYAECKRRLSPDSEPTSYFDGYALAMKASEAETVLSVRRHIPVACDIEEELLASGR